MVLACAADFGLTGHETGADLDANRASHFRMEPIHSLAAHGKTPCKGRGVRPQSTSSGT